MHARSHIAGKRLVKQVVWCAELCIPSRALLSFAAVCLPFFPWCFSASFRPGSPRPSFALLQIQFGKNVSCRLDQNQLWNATCPFWIIYFSGFSHMLPPFYLKEIKLAAGFVQAGEGEARHAKLWLLTSNTNITSGRCLARTWHLNRTMLTLLQNNILNMQICFWCYSCRISCQNWWYHKTKIILILAYTCQLHQPHIINGSVLKIHRKYNNINTIKWEIQNYEQKIKI